MQVPEAGARDEGVRLAIDAAGSVAALARGLGIAQPSVSGWRRVPADRVAAVEALTGVNRDRLRPDLFALAQQSRTEAAASEAAVREIDPLDAARAQEYLLLAALVTKPPTQALLNSIAGIRGDASPLGMGLLNTTWEYETTASLGKVLTFVCVILFLQWKPAGIISTRSRALD